jgi:NAD(P)H-dependent flavin oxidoreductase YrpB (nitropropane dioxygenase family)
VTTLPTAWSRAMGLRVPLLNAPMGGVAGGSLAAAVSCAGGLGMIGIGSTGSVALLERESELPGSTGVPFGIGLLDWAVAREPALLDASISAAPVLMSVSFGDDADQNNTYEMPRRTADCRGSTSDPWVRAPLRMVLDALSTSRSVVSLGLTNSRTPLCENSRLLASFAGRSRTHLCTLNWWYAVSAAPLR